MNELIKKIGELETKEMEYLGVMEHDYYYYKDDFEDWVVSNYGTSVCRLG